MSETNKNAEEKREPYVVELETPLKFEYDAEASVLTSTKLGSLINEYFRLVFPGDYEGCKIETSKNGLALSLCFRHETNRTEDTIYGVELSTAKKTNNNLLDVTRRRDFVVQHGDRYSLTQDGEDIIKPLLQRGYFGNNGKVNWGAVISEISEGTYGNMYSMKTTQFTKISGLDINAVCALLFGKKDADGNAVVYDVSLKAALNGAPGMNSMANQILVLWVNRINYDKLCETYRDLGFGTVSSIIR